MIWLIEDYYKRIYFERYQDGQLLIQRTEDGDGSGNRPDQENPYTSNRNRFIEQEVKNYVVAAQARSGDQTSLMG
jgi:hypothetical protein